MPSVDINGQVVQFPDGMSDQELQTAVRAAAAQLGGAKPVGVGGRFMQGVGDIPQGGAQFLANVLPSGVVNAVNSATQWINDQPIIGPATKAMGMVPATAEQLNQQTAQREQDYQAARRAAGSTGFDWPRLGGQVAASMPLAVAIPAGGTIGGAAATGALTGAIQGAIQPAVDPNSSYAGQSIQNAAQGALFGAGAGAIGRMLANAVSPPVGANVQTLKNAGVELTPGQIAGGGYRKLEDAATSIPIVGGGIDKAQRRSLESFNRAVANEVLDPIGQKVAKDAPAGRVLLNQVDDVIGKAYDSALSRVKPFVPDQQFVQDFRSMMNSNIMMPDQKAFFTEVLNRNIIPRLQASGQIDGKTFQTITSELKRYARQYGASQAVPDQELGRAFRALNDAFDELVARTNPSIAPQIKQANAAFARLVRMEGAASSVGAKEGVFTPGQLQSAVRRGDMTPRKGEFASGNALMQNISDPAVDVLPRTVPDSGTPFRGALQALTATGAAGYIDPLLAATYAGATGLGRAAYSKPGIDALRWAMLANRPDLIRGLAGPLAVTGQLTGSPGFNLMMNQARTP